MTFFFGTQKHHERISREIIKRSDDLRLKFQVFSNCAKALCEEQTAAWWCFKTHHANFDISDVKYPDLMCLEVPN